jgi:preprotein translocase subunit SecG
MRLFLFFSYILRKEINQYDLNFISIILTKRKSKNQNLIFGSSKENALDTLSGDRRVCFFEKITFILVTALLIFTMLISF